MDCSKKPPRRQAVLISVASDGYIEAFADKNIDVKIQRIPAATSQFGERAAEACFEQLLPKRFRDLWRRDFLRANAISRPLTAEAALKALAALDFIAAMEPFMPPKRKSRKGAA
jgi:hypothetical protein